MPSTEEQFAKVEQLLRNAVERYAGSERDTLRADERTRELAVRLPGGRWYRHVVDDAQLDAMPASVIARDILDRWSRARATNAR